MGLYEIYRPCASSWYLSVVAPICQIDTGLLLTHLRARLLYHERMVWRVSQQVSEFVQRMGNRWHVLPPVTWDQTSYAVILVVRLNRSQRKPEKCRSNYYYNNYLCSVIGVDSVNKYYEGSNYSLVT